LIIFPIYFEEKDKKYLYLLGFVEEINKVNSALAPAFFCLLTISALSSTSLLPMEASAAQQSGSACPDGWVKSKQGECSKNQLQE
jgi:hypothetical protein